MASGGRGLVGSHQDADAVGCARREVQFTTRPLGFQVGADLNDKAVVTRLEDIKARDKGVWVGAKIRSVNGEDTEGETNYGTTIELLKRAPCSEQEPLVIVFGDVFQKGDKVLANRRGEGVWFRATIQDASGDLYMIRFNDGLKENKVPPDRILKRPPPEKSEDEHRRKSPPRFYGRNHEFEIGKNIGAGSFGQVFLGKDNLTGDAVAIKFESTRTSSPQLYHEFKIMRRCMANKVSGIPRGLWCEEQDKHRVLIMDLLGPSLEDLFNFCGRQFSVKTTLMLADQMVSRLQSLHQSDYIHRDIKTDNFCMGLRKGTLRVVHLIDFGLSKLYMVPSSSGKPKHISIRTGKSLTGTPRYVSINVHKGIEPSRRDDLESTGYLFLYFLRSKLPWQGQQAATREEKYRKIMRIKRDRIGEVCRGLPDCFEKYAMYCRKLKFDETPDYKRLGDWFKGSFKDNQFKLDFEFDWNLKLNRKEYKPSDLKVPTLARLKSEERIHLDEINKMMQDGDLDEDDDIERRMAEMEGINAEILGSLDKGVSNADEDAQIAGLYQAVRSQSIRYSKVNNPKDNDSITSKHKGVEKGAKGKKKGKRNKNDPNPGKNGCCIIS